MSAPSASRRLALAAATAQAAARAGAAARAREGRGVEPGDRFVLPATADWPVEWVLLEGGENGHLAVPADVHPLVGSRDVELPPGSEAGALRLRCGFPVRLEAGRLAPELRVGALDRITLEKARREVRAGSPASGSEVDDSAAYQEWIRDTVCPAVAAVGGAVRLENGPAARSGWPRAAVLALAASWALVITGALAGWKLWQQSLTGLQRERAAHERTVRAALEGGNRRVARLEETHEREVKRLEERLARLETAPTPARKPLINLPAVKLYPDLLRSEPKPIRLTPKDPSLIVTLSLDEEWSHSAYRVVLTRSGRREPIWKEEGLEPSDGEVTLELPSELLPPGSYRFQVFGRSGNPAEPLAGYGLAIIR